MSSFPTENERHYCNKLAEVEKKVKLRQTRVWPRVLSFWGGEGALFLVSLAALGLC